MLQVNAMTTNSVVVIAEQSSHLTLFRISAKVYTKTYTETADFGLQGRERGENTINN